MKKNKKKKPEKKLRLKENIIITENISYNFLLLDNIEFHSRSMLLITPMLESNINEIKSSVDSINEISEMDSLRLQMSIDRMSKFVEALSNIMKKIDSTQKIIVQNLKG